MLFRCYVVASSGSKFYLRHVDANCRPTTPNRHNRDNINWIFGEDANSVGQGMATLFDAESKATMDGLIGTPYHHLPKNCHPGYGREMYVEMVDPCIMDGWSVWRVAKVMSGKMRFDETPDEPPVRKIPCPANKPPVRKIPCLDELLAELMIQVAKRTEADEDKRKLVMDSVRDSVRTIKDALDAIVSTIREVR